MIVPLPGRQFKLLATGEVFNTRADAESAKMKHLAKKWSKPPKPAEKPKGKPGRPRKHPKPEESKTDE